MKKLLINIGVGLLAIVMVALLPAIGIYGLNNVGLFIKALDIKGADIFEPLIKALMSFIIIIAFVIYFNKESIMDKIKERRAKRNNLI